MNRSYVPHLQSFTPSRIVKKSNPELAPAASRSVNQLSNLPAGLVD